MTAPLSPHADARALVPWWGRSFVFAFWIGAAHGDVPTAAVTSPGPARSRGLLTGGATE